MKFKVLSKNNKYYVGVSHGWWIEKIDLNCKDGKSAYKCFVDLLKNSTFKDLPMALYGCTETNYVLSTYTNKKS